MGTDQGTVMLAAAVQDGLKGGSSVAILVTGPVRCGKTTMCSRVFAELDPSIVVVPWDTSSCTTIPSIDVHAARCSSTEKLQKCVILADDVSLSAQCRSCAWLSKAIQCMRSQFNGTILIVTMTSTRLDMRIVKLFDVHIALGHDMSGRDMSELDLESKLKSESELELELDYEYDTRGHDLRLPVVCKPALERAWHVAVMLSYIEDDPHAWTMAHDVHKRARSLAREPRNRALTRR